MTGRGVGRSAPSLFLLLPVEGPIARPPPSRDNTPFLLRGQGLTRLHDRPYSSRFPLSSPHLLSALGQMVPPAKPPPKLYVEALTSNASKSDCIRRRGL